MITGRSYGVVLVDLATGVVRVFDLLTHLLSRRVPLRAVLLLSAALCTGGLRGQVLLPETAQLLPEDLAVLAGEEDRTDLPCEVTPVKPAMDFDLRFHTGYLVSLPLKSIAGRAGNLRILLRVTPVESPARSFTLGSQIRVPYLDPDSAGESQLPGDFAVGAGRYRIDWLMRDRSERVCSSHWTIEARPDSAYRDLALPIQPGMVQAPPPDGFGELPAVSRDPGRPLRLKLLLNFAPGDPDLDIPRRRDIRALAYMVRAIARESRFSLFSIAAFSMDEQRVFYRQPESRHIDFPALGEAVKSLKSGTVAFHHLLEKNSSTNFLTSLLSEQLGPCSPAPDAIVIVSPKVMLDKNPDREDLAGGGAARPIFYLNYNTDPRENPWQDAIGAALKAYGGIQYSISSPRDLGRALVEMKDQLRALR